MNKLTSGNYAQLIRNMRYLNNISQLCDQYIASEMRALGT